MDLSENCHFQLDVPVCCTYLLMASVRPARRQTKVDSLAVVWMTPPPSLLEAECRKSSGRPIILPNQSITITSSSVQAGLDA